MDEGKKLWEQTDEFNKLCLDLENIDIKYDDENKALVLLHSLPKSYETFVDILKHGRDKLSLDDVTRALSSKELQHKVEGKNSIHDALTVGTRLEIRDPKFKGRSRSKSRNGRKMIRCYHCHDEGHKNCPKRKSELLEKNPGISSSVCEVDYDSADAL